MANVVLSAQHYLECENCEENPAKFVCKTCPGHLCENCKSEHVKKKIGKKTVATLKKAEKEGLQESDKFKDNIEEHINQLQLMCERMSPSLEAKPELAFFKAFQKSGLEKFEKLPTQPNYSLTDFNPGNISQDLQRTFGVPPMLQRSRHAVREIRCLKDVTVERGIEYGCSQEDEDVYRAESTGITVPIWWQLMLIR